MQSITVEQEIAIATQLSRAEADAHAKLDALDLAMLERALELSRRAFQSLPAQDPEKWRKKFLALTKQQLYMTDAQFRVWEAREREKYDEVPRAAQQAAETAADAVRFLRL